MDRDLWTTVLASVLWSFVGAFIALEIGQNFQFGQYFWGIGVIIGSLIGYVSGDFADFRSGVARAYQQTIAWRPDRLFWRSAFLTFAAPVVILCHLTAFIFVVMFFSGNLTANWPEMLKIISGFIVVISCFLSLMWMIDEMNDSSHLPNIERRWRNHIEFQKDIIFNLNPFSFWFYLVPNGIWWLVVRIPSGAVLTASALARAARTFGRFVATTFYYVHTHKRTIRMVAVAIGAAIGYQAGSAIIGAVVGGFVSYVEYQLVAVHILGVVPNGARAS